MRDTSSFTTKSHVFQDLLGMVGSVVQSDLVRQVEYLRVENKILRSRLKKRVRLTPGEQQQILRYGRPLGASIKKIITITSYQTFRRWLRERGLIKFRPGKPGRGRPKTRKEIREIILRMARENPWGYTRILSELKKLNIKSVSRNTVKNILKQAGFDPAKVRGFDTWDAFIKRHLETLWACDFFTKTVWTFAGPKVFFILFIINVKTRKVHILGMSKKPTQEWVTNKARSIGFLFESKKPQLLMRDRDTKYSKGFNEVLRGFNVESKALPFRSPNLNPYAESWVSIIRRECLDHFFVFGERHLRYLVTHYSRYYNTKRPHSGVNRVFPETQLPQGKKQRLCCQEELGGLLKHYYWG